MGEPRHADDAAMIATIERALQAGIDAAGPGVRIGDISFAMGSVLHDAGYLITDADGWTLRSATGCRTAHSEHTIAITEDGVEILTQRPE